MHTSTSGLPLPTMEQPTYDIEQPHGNDVLSGRGVTTNRHEGNTNFRSLVALNKVRFGRAKFLILFFSICVCVHEAATAAPLAVHGDDTTV